jgi:hypothetical protein
MTDSCPHSGNSIYEENLEMMALCPHLRNRRFKDKRVEDALMIARLINALIKYT